MVVVVVVGGGGGGGEGWGILVSITTVVGAAWMRVGMSGSIDQVHDRTMNPIVKYRASVILLS